MLMTVDVAVQNEQLKKDLVDLKQQNEQTAKVRNNRSTIELESLLMTL